MHQCKSLKKIIQKYWLDHHASVYKVETTEGMLIDCWNRNWSDNYGCQSIFERTNPDKKIIGLDLTKNNIVSSGTLDPLKIQDISSGFVPYNLEEDILDEVIRISNDEVVETVKKLPF